LSEQAKKAGYESSSVMDNDYLSVMMLIVGLPFVLLVTLCLVCSYKFQRIRTCL